MFAGATGVGKTTLARAVARELSSAYLDKDTIRDAALALAREMKVENAAPFAAALSYGLLIPLARDNVTVGTHVVIDSPAGHRSFQDAIEELVRSVRVSFRLIECISTDEALLSESRGRDGDAYQQARERLERLSGPRLVIDTAEPVQVNLRKIMHALGLPEREASEAVADAAASVADTAPAAGIADSAIATSQTEKP